jgi:hypothetical protein
MTVHTAGWVRVWAVEDGMSLATVTHACDAIEVGDYLDPFSCRKRSSPTRTSRSGTGPLRACHVGR